jgi:hypothetical protein
VISALVAGAVGRLGEAVLNQVIARGKYDQVIALGRGAIASSVRGLSLAPSLQLPAVNDAYFVLSDPNDPSHRSFYGRDASFDIVTRDSLLSVARAAASAGARRALLIAPMPAWQQVGQIHQALSHHGESELAALSFQALTVLRPAATPVSSAVGFAQRLARIYLDLQFLMLPRSIPMLTSEQLARAAVIAMHQSSSGIAVLLADRISHLLEAHG